MTPDWAKTAQVGDKVTQLEHDEDWFPMLGEQVPEFGVVYTIRSIYADYDGVYLRFDEITNCPMSYADGFEELAFDAFGFRPVQPRKTDISIFTDMLKTVEQPLKEEA
jgi:hypothetical protein